MDLATMVVILLFRGGDSGHFIQAQPNMSACLRTVASERHAERTSGSAETDYVIYRVCLPVSPRLFAGIPSRSGKPRSSPCDRGELRASTASRPGTLYLRWTGRISAPLYKNIALQFEKAKSQVRTVYLQISSCGGDAKEMERTVGLLRSIKKTHTLETIVDRGGLCASACVPVFLQGERRRGALTSSWVFHEAWRWADRHRADVRVDRTVTERLFQDYFEPAGVSEKWLNHLRIMVQQSDYWQTGEDLWADKSGIITDPLDNLVLRARSCSDIELRIRAGCRRHSA